MNRKGESTYSTLGCLITVGDNFCAITSAHAYCKDRDENHFDNIKNGLGVPLYTPIYRATSQLVSSSNSIIEPNPGNPDNPRDAPDDDEEYFIDDIEYESVGEDNDGTTSPSRYTASEEQCYSTLAESDCCHDEDDQDLDWCLIRLDEFADLAYLRRNAFALPDQSNPVFLPKVAEPLPTQESEVFILTSSKPPPRGMIQPGISMLGGINGKRRSMVWNVILDNGHGRYLPTLDTHPQSYSTKDLLFGSC